MIEATTGRLNAMATVLDNPELYSVDSIRMIVLRHSPSDPDVDYLVGEISKIADILRS